MVSMVNWWMVYDCYTHMNPNWLVGATYPSEKYYIVNWDDDIPYMK